MTHTCHWPGCDKKVPPKLWGCREHWWTLPGYIRSAIWDAYVPGQEVRKDPSKDYIRAAELAQDFAVEYERLKTINKS